MGAAAPRIAGPSCRSHMQRLWLLPASCACAQEVAPIDGAEFEPVSEASVTPKPKIPLIQVSSSGTVGLVDAASATKRTTSFVAVEHNQWATLRRAIQVSCSKPSHGWRVAIR